MKARNLRGIPAFKGEATATDRTVGRAGREWALLFAAERLGLDFGPSAASFQKISVVLQDEGGRGLSSRVSSGA